MKFRNGPYEGGRAHRTNGISVFVVGLSAFLFLFADACTTREDSFESDFRLAPDRIWVGPEYYANRMLDWRVRGGRLECLEGRAAKPMRTVHLLTHYLTAVEGTLEMSVQIGSALRADSVARDTWSGFLVGAGGDDVDFRISALVHHWPAPGGGLVVAVDENGAITVRNNENPDAKRGPRGDFTADDWPEFEPVERTGSAGSWQDIMLGIRAAPRNGAYDLVVTVSDPVRGEDLTIARYEDLEAKYFEGTLALVSHGSPDGSGSGYRFERWKASGSKLVEDTGRAFGPVMGTQYTLSGGELKMTAQMGALGPDDTPSSELEVRSGGTWERVATAGIDSAAFTATFRVPDWTNDGDVDYRVAYDLQSTSGAERYYYTGVVRSQPRSDSVFVMAAFTGQNVSGGDGSWTHDNFWYPHAELARAVAWHDPDLLFFSGDQIYEGGLAGIVREPVDKAILDYLYHWYRFIWAFRDLTRDRPTITTPDDHDVYHGNIWGAGGKSTAGPFRPFSDNGGYRMDPAFVNVVHRTQTSHLPDPIDAAPIDRGISVYYTNVDYGGVSFAVVSDRMWKSAPRPLLPQARIVNGWPQNPAFDAVHESDVDGAVLLGERQLSFLSDWVRDWSGGAWMKVLLSQTLFSDLATIPREAMSGSVLPGLPLPEEGERISTDKKAADMDSGGWPQTGRNRALSIVRRGLAFHVGGDQHLGSVVHYGIDAFDDAAYGFAVPSIANIWPRRWFPPEEGLDRARGAPWYTGRHLDGFGNRMTVHAAANPVRSHRLPEALYDRTPGYGIIRMNRRTRRIVMEAWPRWVDPRENGAAQYGDWPVEFSQFENDGRKAAGYLPTIESKLPESVVEITDATTGEHLYTIRIPGTHFRAKVFSTTDEYRVAVTGRDGGEHIFENVRATDDRSAVLRVDF